jgi:uncharacterized protein YutE (UPF0331/DUF86 family)
VSPEVVKKKLLALGGYLDDLKVHESSTFDEFMKQHYEVERLIELLLMTPSDIVFHLLIDRGEPAPGSYRTAFLRAGEIGILSPQLAANLARGAGLRGSAVCAPASPR